jgi:hypothetical protein
MFCIRNIIPFVGVVEGFIPMDFGKEQFFFFRQSLHELICVEYWLYVWNIDKI